MKTLVRAHVRRVATLLLLVLTAAAIKLATFLPFRIHGYRPEVWVGVLYARGMLAIYNVRVSCPDRARISQHAGLVFINHLSHLDTIAWLSMGPTRALAAAEVRDYPLVGTISNALGTIYVKRDDRPSRAEARRQVIAALRRDPRPPIVIAVEGKLGPGDYLLPFRYGAFAIAAETAVPVQLWVFRYTPLDVAIWHGGRGETLGDAIWRLGEFAGPMQVEFTLVDTLHPQPGDDPIALADAAHQAMSSALGLPNRGNVLLKDAAAQAAVTSSA